MKRGRHAIREQISAVRKDRGHARSHGVALDNRGVPYAHPGDVRDGVEVPWRKHARLDAEVARASALRGERARDGGHREERGGECVVEMHDRGLAETSPYVRT